MKTILVDATNGNGERETLLAYVLGTSVVVVPNEGKPAQAWLKEAVLAQLASGKGPDGVEQG